MRLLIFICLIYLGYRVFKSYIFPEALQKPKNQPAGEIEDIMIKDPYCQVYFPKHSGVCVKIDGHEVYFCSKECKEKFINSQSNNYK